MRITVTSPDFKIQEAAIDRLFKAFPVWSGNEALNFYKASFARQGFAGKTFRRWKPRKDKDNSRNLLVGQGGGRLRRSMRRRSITNGWEIYTDTEYAKLHNEGGGFTYTPSAKQRRFFWAMFYKFKKRNPDKAGMWKGMALAKTLTVKMPQRQFMDIQREGLSPALQKRFVRHLNRGIESALKG